ncbi:hypothetical protein F5J12DRAFT_783851 [Pisolithus orientalis]|uniref:uncharacterized protein n=1 Tax=Pisolithus orientalis TaxID=936130 RepID=UPI0022247660|nr:uncharacterized protein F5J12DRAFT_783851 [Pisolithus orientalis]KAI6002373.1 hypothetical protein F5J12DRAFT_783851 [Pisolithus orientalis]
MAYNRNHGKLQAFDDMPMMDSDNSNEEGFVSAAKELYQCIDEWSHILDVANAARTAVSDALKLCFLTAAYPSPDVDESQSPSKQCKKKTLPSHCKSADLEFQRLIREHAQLLMGRENTKSLFTNVPTKEEATAYQSAQGPACTPDAFCVDLNDVPSATWNKSASHVFTDSFCNAYPSCGCTLKQICTAWVVHFNYLCQIYATQQQVTCTEQACIGRIVAGHATGNNVDDVGILDQQQCTCRHQERKSQLYMRHLRAANTHARAYPTASHVVQELGVAGMSSDKSDHEARWGETTYMITKKMWRANQFLDSLDPHSFSDLDIQDVIELNIPESLTKLTKEYDVFDKQIICSLAHNLA